MAFTKHELIELYRQRARWYDLSANLYYFTGFRETAYRKKAISALALQQGDTVVELGCGTGLNFARLQKVVGSSGRIIGVDLTDAMLEEAKERIRRKGWSNVQLIRSDAAAFDYPPRVDGVLSTFALTLFPEYDAIIQRGAGALSQGGKFVILDFKKPDNAPGWLIRIMLLITKPFGITLDLADRHPWESMARFLSDSRMQEHFFGFVYIATGNAR